MALYYRHSFNIHFMMKSHNLRTGYFIRRFLPNISVIIFQWFFPDFLTRSFFIRVNIRK